SRLPPRDPELKRCRRGRFGLSRPALLRPCAGRDRLRPQPMSQHGWREVLASLREPRVLVMLALGLSAGLPFLLTGNTLGAWLRDEGTELAAIGFISWVGLAYSLKFLWAPVLDRARLPGIGRLGKRRSWI